MPRKEKIVTLVMLYNTLKIDNEVVDIDPLILFSRVILLTEREEDATVEYGLTNYPRLLFKDGMVRSSNKASLLNYLTKGIPNSNLPTEIVQVIDGRALLYQVKWCLYTKFSDFCKLHERHLYKNSDTAMLCLMVMKTVPPQKICDIQKVVVKLRPTLPSRQIQNV